MAAVRRQLHRPMRYLEFVAWRIHCVKLVYQFACNETTLQFFVLCFSSFCGKDENSNRLITPDWKLLWKLSLYQMEPHFFGFETTYVIWFSTFTASAIFLLSKVGPILNRFFFRATWKSGDFILSAQTDSAWLFADMYMESISV